jgi:hypothetical protein
MTCTASAAVSSGFVIIGVVAENPDVYHVEFDWMFAFDSSLQIMESYSKTMAERESPGDAIDLIDASAARPNGAWATLAYGRGFPVEVIGN